MSILFGESSPNNTIQTKISVRSLKNAMDSSYVSDFDNPRLSNTWVNSQSEGCDGGASISHRVLSVFSGLPKYNQGNKPKIYKNSFDPLKKEVEKDIDVKIDTLSITGKFETLEKLYGYVDDECMNAVNMRLQQALGVKVSKDIKGGRNYYKYGSRIEYTDDTREQRELGFAAWGGELNKGTFQIYFTGECCEYLSMADLWNEVYSMAFDFKMKITRIDIAYDDYEGELGVDDALSMWKNFQFKITQQPKMQQVGNWETVDEKGRTFYVGKRESGKMLRVYEKGKQLGDKLSKWTRWELELQSKQREIPLKAIICPNLYYAGAYPALGKILPSTPKEVIKTVKKKVKTTLNDAFEVAKTQMGKLVNYARQMGLSDSEIVERIIRDGMPKRLIHPRMTEEKSSFVDESDIVKVDKENPIKSGFSGVISLIPKEEMDGLVNPRMIRIKMCASPSELIPEWFRRSHLIPFDKAEIAP